MIAQDIQLDDDGDLLIRNGDFVIGPSDNQHIQDLINASVGWWKEFPLVGVGIENYQGSSGAQQQLERSIKVQLEGDGYSLPTIKAIQEPDGTFTIIAEPTRI